MWITIVWPEGRENKRWVRTLRELDALIGAQMAFGLTADLESNELGAIRLKLSAA
jgi:hypothetical protein